MTRQEFEALEDAHDKALRGLVRKVRVGNWRITARPYRSHPVGIRYEIHVSDPDSRDPLRERHAHPEELFNAPSDVFEAFLALRRADDRWLAGDVEWDALP